ncbi:MAG: HAMP domain-containing histidine kinase [Meiothermus sp.]|jgi:signal transduction histidine kinase|nr:HAMP domain-containing histidine kinase [Meiothermus sp.]
MSLRLRLALIAFSLTLLGLGVGLFVTYQVLERSRLADLDKELRFQAGLVLQAALHNQGIPDSLAEALTQDNRAQSAQVYRGLEKIWEGGSLISELPFDARMLGQQGPSEIRGLRVYTLSQGDLSVQLSEPLWLLRDALNSFVEIAVPTALLLALFSAGLAYLAAGLAVRPLERLAHAAANFERGADIPSISGKDEAATLAQSFAGLMGHLKEQRTREQQFLAYAAHELRTPLSAFRASLEAARLRGQVAPDQLNRLHHEALRLETLAQNLLALSRAESGGVRGQPLDLADLVSEAFDRFQPLALERGLELGLEADPAPAYADPRLLEQALNNLVHNALRYTTKGGVTLRSGLEKGWAWLEVADTGPGFRKDAPEGLGLRVVRAVAQALNGELDIQQHQGSQVRLRLPQYRPRTGG